MFFARKKPAYILVPYNTIAAAYIYMAATPRPEPFDPRSAFKEKPSEISDVGTGPWEQLILRDEGS